MAAGEVEVTAAGSKSKQRPGTTSVAEADVTAGSGADTDMVTSWLGHCVEHAVGGRVANSPSRTAHAVRTVEGVVGAEVAIAAPGIDVDRSVSSSTDAALGVAAIAGSSVAVHGCAARKAA